MGVEDNEPGDREGLGAPEHGRSGATVDEAVETAEAGSQVEGKHTPSGQAASGESRVERMVDVERESTNRAEPEKTREAGAPISAGPSPADIGSGGAQRIAGARISDRVAGGEPAPDGPPFDSDAAQ